jgi:hypothetical protein
MLTHGQFVNGPGLARSLLWSNLLGSKEMQLAKSCAGLTTLPTQKAYQRTSGKTINFSGF